MVEGRNFYLPGSSWSRSLSLNWSDTVTRLGTDWLNTSSTLLGWSGLLLWSSWLVHDWARRLLSQSGLIGDCVWGTAGISTGQSQKKLTLLQALEVISIIVLTTLNTLWVLALSTVFISSDLEDGTDWATVLTWAVIQADVVFTAVFWVSMTGEGTWVWIVAWWWALESSLSFWKQQQILKQSALSFNVIIANVAALN